MDTFKSVCCYWLSILVMLQNLVFAFTCGISNFTEVLSGSEGSFTNITYTQIFSETSTVVYVVCQNNRLKTKCTFKRREKLNEATVKSWDNKNDSVCSMELLDVSNTMSASEIKISQLNTRSLTAMRLYLENYTNNEKTFYTLRLIRLEVLYPPKVTSLTVNGQEVNSTHAINEGKEVNISCSSDTGNPPVAFRLLDKKGNKLAEGEDNLSLSLSVRCEEDWPRVRCEGTGSEHNRTVSLLVRCPPQFVDKTPRVVDQDTHEIWTFRIRAHTTALDRCLLTTVASEDTFFTDVNCTLSGNPPELLLTIFLYKEDKIKRRHWSLTLRNNKGSSTTTSTTPIVHTRSRPKVIRRKVNTQIQKALS